MNAETTQQGVKIIESEVRSRASASEFEVAYQVRVAIDRIKFASRDVVDFSTPCAEMRDAALQFLDALDRVWSKNQAARE
jgi:hypothetical protein